MKLNLPREWFEGHITDEGNSDIGAGYPSTCSFFQVHEESESVEAPEEALGVLVNLKRREMGLSIDKLAETARIDAAEIKSIECHAHHNINPRTIHQLATVFKLPTRSLLKLSGAVETHDSGFKEQAVRFAARSENISSLNRNERKLLSEFVGFLSSQAQD